MKSSEKISAACQRNRPVTAVFMALIIALLVTSCGSTKVYTADKTLVYRDSIYNVSNTRVFSRKSEAVLPGNETINLATANKDSFEALVDEHGDIRVQQVFLFDDTEVIYQAMQVDSWKDYTRMEKSFDGAAKDLQKFLADKKKTQLKLK